MRLTTALRLDDGEVVAFVGGGGKTTAMFRLADEIVEAGGRVITTTTTSLALAEVGSAPAHFSAFEIDRARLEAALDKKSHVLLTGPMDLEKGQAAGVTLGLISSLRAVPDLTAILIKADDAQQRPFKAPAESEPEIPEEATLVVPVVGAEVFGQSLTGANAQHLELIRVLTGAAEGAPITPQLVARVLRHPQGGLKNVPAEARVIPLINQIETAEQLAAARETAGYLLRTPAVMSVALGVVRRSNPVREAHGRVAAIVLAAGRSTRMERPKPTLEWSGGRTIIGQVVQQLRACDVNEIVVVTGSARAEVEAALAADGASVHLVFNPDFEKAEMARSLQVGLQNVPAGCLAVLVALGDQPQIEPQVAQAVIQRWRETHAPVVAPVYRQQRGHPLLFDRSAWPGLQALPPEAQPRDFLEAAGRIESVEVDTDSILRDVDTPEDYDRERGRISG